MSVIVNMLMDFAATLPGSRVLPLSRLQINRLFIECFHKWHTKKGKEKEWVKGRQQGTSEMGYDMQVCHFLPQAIYFIP